MGSKPSSAYVLALLALIPTNRTPWRLNSSAVCRVTSSDPTTYGQWLHVKKRTRTRASSKSDSRYDFPSVAGSVKSRAFSPICKVKVTLLLLSPEGEEALIWLHRRQTAASRPLLRLRAEESCRPVAGLTAGIKVRVNHR